MLAYNINGQSNYRPPQSNSHGSVSGGLTYGGYTHRLANTGFPDRPEFFPHYRSFRPERLWKHFVNLRLHAGNTLAQWQLVVWKEENRPQMDLSRTCDRCAVFGLECRRSDGAGRASLGIRGPGGGGDVYGTLTTIEAEPLEDLLKTNHVKGTTPLRSSGGHYPQATTHVQAAPNNVWTNASPLFSTARRREPCCDNCRIAGGFHELHCSFWVHDPMPKALRLQEISSELERRGIANARSCTTGNGSNPSQMTFCMQTSPRFTPRCLSCAVEDFSMGITGEQDREKGFNACSPVDGDVKCLRCREMGRECTQKREFVDLAVCPPQQVEGGSMAQASDVNGVVALFEAPILNELGHVIELPRDFNRQLLAISRRANGFVDAPVTPELDVTPIDGPKVHPTMREVSAAPSTSTAFTATPTNVAFPQTIKTGSTGKSMCLTCKNKIMTHPKNRRSAKSCESDHENGRGCSQCVNYGLVCVYEGYVMPRNQKKQSHIGYIPCESCKAAARTAVEEEGRQAQENSNDDFAAHDTRDTARSSSATERALLLCDRKHPCDRCTNLGIDCQRVPNEQNRMVGLIKRGTPGDDLEAFYHGLGRHHLATDGQKPNKGKPWIMPDDYHFEYLKQLGVPLPSSADEPVPVPGREGPEPQWLVELRRKRRAVSVAGLSVDSAAAANASNGRHGAAIFTSESFAPVSDVD